jgi:hypothetical protein
MVVDPVHAPSHVPLLLPPPSFTQSPSSPRSLVRDGQTSPLRPRLVVSRSTCPPLSPSPPREHLCNRYYSNKHTHMRGVDFPRAGPSRSPGRSRRVINRIPSTIIPLTHTSLSPSLHRLCVCICTCVCAYTHACVHSVYISRDVDGKPG